MCLHVRKALSGQTDNVFYVEAIYVGLSGYLVGLGILLRGIFLVKTPTYCTLTNKFPGLILLTLFGSKLVLLFSV